MKYVIVPEEWRIPGEPLCVSLPEAENVFNRAIGRARCIGDCCKSAREEAEAYRHAIERAETAAVCAWCNRDILPDGNPGPAAVETAETSHGICRPCAIKVESE